MKRKLKRLFSVRNIIKGIIIIATVLLIVSSFLPFFYL